MPASRVRSMGVSMPDMPRAVKCVSAAQFLARFACMWYLARLKTTQPTSLGVFVHALAFSASPYQTGLSVLVYRALVMNTATTVGVRAIRGYSEEKDQTAANA